MKYIIIFLTFICIEILPQDYSNDLNAIQASYESPLPAQYFLSGADINKFKNLIKALSSYEVSDTFDLVGNSLLEDEPIRSITVREKNSGPRATEFKRTDTTKAADIKALFKFLDDKFRNNVLVTSKISSLNKSTLKKKSKYGYLEDRKVNDAPFIPSVTPIENKKVEEKKPESDIDSSETSNLIESSGAIFGSIKTPNTLLASINRYSSFGNVLNLRNNYGYSNILKLSTPSLTQIPAADETKNFIKFDFSLSRLVIGWSGLSKTLMGGDEKRYIFSEFEFNATEKLLNILPLQNNSIYIGPRILLPLSSSATQEIGADLRIYLKLRNSIYLNSKLINSNPSLVMFNRNYDLRSKLNYPDISSLAVDFSLYDDPFYINVWGCMALSKKDVYKDPLLTMPRYIENTLYESAYFNFNQLQITHGFYFDFNRIHLFKLNIGFGTHDVVRAFYSTNEPDGFNVSTVQSLEQGLRPVFDLQYNFVIRNPGATDYYLFGMSGKYYDNQIKANAWINVFNNDFIPFLIVRPEMYMTSGSLARNKNPWDDEGGLAFMLRLIFNFEY